MKPSEESLTNEEEEGNDILKDFHLQQKKYAQQKISKKKTGASKREEDTLALLKKFQQKLEGVKSKQPPTASENPSDDAAGDADSESWLQHTLKFEDATPNVARDANLKDDDWFEIYDPRNPLNKRRREESKKLMKEKGKSKQNDI